MQTLGQKFRQAREAKGLNIDDIAAELRINAQYLTALEADDVSKVPGDFFYRSFIRQYARRLEIPDKEFQSEIERSLVDQERLLEALPSQLPERRYEVPPMPTLGGPTPEDARRWMLRLAGLILVLAACSGVYALWLKYKSMQAAPAAARVEVNTPAPQAPPPAPKTEETKLQEVKPETAVPEPPKTEPQKTEAPKPEPAKPPAAVGSPVRLTVVAKEPTWLDVWRGGQHVFAAVLQPGDSKSFDAPDRLRIRLGNAGGVALEHNGKAIPPAGPRGQVRVVDFTADKFEVVGVIPPNQ